MGEDDGSCANPVACTLGAGGVTCDATGSTGVSGDLVANDCACVCESTHSGAGCSVLKCTDSDYVENGQDAACATPVACTLGAGGVTCDATGSTGVSGDLVANDCACVCESTHSGADCSVLNPVVTTAPTEAP